MIVPLLAQTLIWSLDGRGRLTLSAEVPVARSCLVLLHYCMPALMPHTYILTDCYFDSWQADFIRDTHAIKIDPVHGLILSIKKWPDDSEVSPNDTNVTDLRGLTVLPGFVDTHVHCTSDFCRYNANIDYPTSFPPPVLRSIMA